ncbi:MAG: hypothetical protein LHW63_03595, partial [Candidatus Cloacimonetes bacterium]|nr:hypothetical protein [Candidatus Cloacimonadota bacterium]
MKTKKQALKKKVGTVFCKRDACNPAIALTSKPLPTKKPIPKGTGFLYSNLYRFYFFRSAVLMLS